MNHRTHLAVPLLLAVLFSLCASPAAAAGPGPFAIAAQAPAAQSTLGQIEGPTEVEPGLTVDFSIKGIPLDQLKGAKILLFPQAKASYWRVLAEWGTGLPVPIFQSRTAREYMILVAYYDGQAVQLLKHEFTVGKEGPGPDPPPPPPPPTGKRWVIILHESKDRTVAQGDVMASRKLRDYLASKGHGFRLIDHEDKTADWLPAYLRLIADRAIALPALIIVDRPPGDSGSGGKVRHVGPLPASDAAVIKTLKEVGG